MLTLPASSAEVERGFSQLKILKSDIRSTLSEERLNDLLAVKLLSADVQNFDPIPAIELWNTSSVRARRPLLMDRAGHRVSSTAAVAVADVASNTPGVAVPGPVATAAETASNPAVTSLALPETARAVSTAATPQSNSEDVLPSAVLPVEEDPEEALDAEDYDTDSDFEEESVDKLIHKYL